MGILKVLSRNKVEEIMKYIEDKEPVRFGDIMTDLEINPNQLNTLLKKMLSENLVRRRKIDGNKYARYYITEKGEESLDLLYELEWLDKVEE